MNFKEKLILPPNGYPGVISVSISRRCTRKCSFCPQSSSIKQEGFMTDEVATELAKQLQDFQGLLSISGTGEPTCHPYFENIIDRLYSTSYNINIISNGDNEDKVLSVSGAYPKIIWTFSEYGVEDTNRNKKYRDINSNFKKTYIKNDFNNRGRRVPNSLHYNRTEVCYIPYLKTFVDVDGNILWCDSDWYSEYPLGNILKDNLFYTWRKNISSYNSPICSQCNANGRIYGKEYYEFWSKRTSKPNISE